MTSENEPRPTASSAPPPSHQVPSPEPPSPEPPSHGPRPPEPPSHEPRPPQPPSQPPEPPSAAAAHPASQPAPRSTRTKSLRRVALVALLCAVLGGGAGFGLARLAGGPDRTTVVIKPSFSPSPEASASPYETLSPGVLTATPDPTSTELAPAPELTPPAEPGVPVTGTPFPASEPAPPTATP